MGHFVKKLIIQVIQVTKLMIKVIYEWEYLTK